MVVAAGSLTLQVFQRICQHSTELDRRTAQHDMMDDALRKYLFKFQTDSERMACLRSRSSTSLPDLHVSTALSLKKTPADAWVFGHALKWFVCVRIGSNCPASAETGAVFRQEFAIMCEKLCLGRGEEQRKIKKCFAQRFWYGHSWRHVGSPRLVTIHGKLKKTRVENVTWERKEGREEGEKKRVTDVEAQIGQACSLCQYYAYGKCEKALAKTRYSRTLSLLCCVSGVCQKDKERWFLSSSSFFCCLFSFRTGNLTTEDVQWVFGCFPWISFPWLHLLDV